MIRDRRYTMEEITVQFSGQVNLTILGEILEVHSTQRNQVWIFNLLSVSDDIAIPGSSDEVQNVDFTIQTQNITITPPFWSLDLIDERNNTFQIITYPNRVDLLTRNIRK